MAHMSYEQMLLKQAHKAAVRAKQTNEYANTAQPAQNTERKVQPAQNIERKVQPAQNTKPKIPLKIWVFGAVGLVILWTLAHPTISPEEARRQQQEMDNILVLSCEASSVTRTQAAACIELGRTAIPH
jgi:hypothetical protein